MTFHRLEKCGLLRASGGVWNYNTIRKSMKLVVEDINEKVYFSAVSILVNYFAALP